MEANTNNKLDWYLMEESQTCAINDTCDWAQTSLYDAQRFFGSQPVYSLVTNGAKIQSK